MRVLIRDPLLFSCHLFVFMLLLLLHLLWGGAEALASCGQARLVRALHK